MFRSSEGEFSASSSTEALAMGSNPCLLLFGLGLWFGTLNRDPAYYPFEYYSTTSDKKGPFPEFPP